MCVCVCCGFSFFFLCFFVPEKSSSSIIFSGALGFFFQAGENKENEMKKFLEFIFIFEASVKAWRTVRPAELPSCI